MRALFAAASTEACADAMLVAAQRDHATVVQFLLDSGVNLHEFNGMTALHWAAANCDLPLMQLLVDRGANLETENEFRGTVLASIVWFANHAMPTALAQSDFAAPVDWLIAAGARTDAYPTMPDDVNAVQDRAKR
jgi:ankyrin repeat protein